EHRHGGGEALVEGRRTILGPGEALLERRRAILQSSETVLERRIAARRRGCLRQRGARIDQGLESDQRLEAWQSDALGRLGNQRRAEPENFGVDRPEYPQAPPVPPGGCP